MNAAEFHQQELEHQQWLEELEKCDEELKTNHGLIINQIRYLRDFIPTGYEKEAVIDRLLDLLGDFENINRKMRSL